MQVYEDTETWAWVYEVLSAVEKQAAALKPSKKKIRKMASNIQTKIGHLKSGLVFLGGDGYVNQQLATEMQITWVAKADFLAAESEGGDAGPQQERWTATTLWQKSLQQALGADWVKVLWQ